VLLDYCTSTTALSDEPDDPFWRALGALNGLTSFEDGLVPSQEQQVAPAASFRLLRAAQRGAETSDPKAASA
jgi:hypothetical protein